MSAKLVRLAVRYQYPHCTQEEFGQHLLDAYEIGALIMEMRRDHPNVPLSEIPLDQQDIFVGYFSECQASMNEFLGVWE